jgi:hypothetical protein
MLMYYSIHSIRYCRNDSTKVYKRDKGIYCIVENFCGVQFYGWPVFKVFAVQLSGTQVIMRLYTVQCFFFMGLFFADSSLSAKNHENWTPQKFPALRSFVTMPSDWWAGKKRKGLVSTACACAVIIQISNNPITYGYFLVYLPFDLNSCVQRTEKWQAWTVRLSREISR